MGRALPPTCAYVPAGLQDARPSLVAPALASGLSASRGCDPYRAHWPLAVFLAVVGHGCEAAAVAICADLAEDSQLNAMALMAEFPPISQHYSVAWRQVAGEGRQMSAAPRSELRLVAGRRLRRVLPWARQSAEVGRAAPSVSRGRKLPAPSSQEPQEPQESWESRRPCPVQRRSRRETRSAVWQAAPAYHASYPWAVSPLPSLSQRFRMARM